MTTPPLMGAPHAHVQSSVGRTMGLVMVALVPATANDLYLFGWPAINLFAVTLITAVAAEAGCLGLMRKPVMPFLLDGSALLSAWLVALTLPPWAPWWTGVLGSVIAIVLAKQVFGGIGQNVFNPAMVARVALLISFPLEMTRFTKPLPLGSEGAPGFLEGLSVTFLGAGDLDALSGASILGHVKTELSRGVDVATALQGYDLLSLGLGTEPGSLGETSAALILLGGLVLLGMRIISWHIPVAMLGTLAALATLFNLIDPAHYPNAAVHLLSGAAMLGAFFIATDLVTSPVTKSGQLLFGAGCGLLVFVIRTWAGYPEGVAFAVLLMNALTPLIDHYIRPRIYGRTRKGTPLSYGDGK